MKKTLNYQHFPNSPVTFKIVILVTTRLLWVFAYDNNVKKTKLQLKKKIVFLLFQL